MSRIESLINLAAENLFFPMSLLLLLLSMSICALRRNSIYLSYFQFHHISTFTYYYTPTAPCLSFTTTHLHSWISRQLYLSTIITYTTNTNTPIICPSHLSHLSHLSHPSSQPASQPHNERESERASQ
ncbi:hypothetical protein BO85DRAFT_265951 [Aspergillus piperis CBS 112811]|uniref:Uncharacterized protein n=1 Tax=Aspergillus piperis CBS 112811 TaxID=1448313 RepID=A0A8G1VMZ5_9EURO|nr:hypothetical protein BO85DRAFT_265951 [Aspergillus piperis CBS 112811]RAH59226.1 hypothetical protein BO85DRAFT_265951 [Aspergillus piperis CBS 112811]